MLKKTENKLPVSTAIDIISNAETLVDAIISLYRAVIDNFDEIEDIDGWPTIGFHESEKIYKAISNRFGTEAMFVWMNKGFSSNDDIEGIPIYHQE